MPKTFANQNIIHIHRDMPQKCDHNFTVVKNQNLYDAYQNLRDGRRGGTAIYLWLVLAGNKDSFDLAFSPKAIAERSGLPESTCRDSFKVLVNKGYLVQKKDGSNIYDFYERPEHAIPKATPTVSATIPKETVIAEIAERPAQPFYF